MPVASVRVLVLALVIVDVVVAAVRVSKSNVPSPRGRCATGLGVAPSLAPVPSACLWCARLGLAHQRHAEGSRAYAGEAPRAGQVRGRALPGARPEDLAWLALVELEALPAGAPLGPALARVDVISLPAALRPRQLELQARARAAEGTVAGREAAVRAARGALDEGASARLRGRLDLLLARVLLELGRPAEAGTHAAGALVQGPSSPEARAWRVEALAGRASSRPRAPSRRGSLTRSPPVVAERVQRLRARPGGGSE
ncbi:MAG: hypothetical protein AB7T09_36750 [Planctomycetota bacterium]